MRSPRDSRDIESSRRHRRSRSRSNSSDAEEERHRRRRRKERESRDGGEDRRSRDDRYSHKESNGRDHGLDDRRNRSYRRSRSPREDTSSRRHRERDDHDRLSLKEREAKYKDGGSEKAVSRKATGPLPSQEASFSANSGGDLVLAGDNPPEEKQKPNFEPTGLLAAASNTVTQVDGSAVTLKYHEPPEARKPSAKDQWKLFVFKGSDIIDTIDLSVRSCWLVGRELSVVDLAAEHPSISKQHAVIQFRFIEKRNEYGDKLGKVKPYLIDLESANGTKLNKEVVPGSRYLELRDKDLVQFGDSTREYVLMLPPK